MDDPFIQNHDASELDIAGEFLTNWLPFLTRDLCGGCSETLTNRILSLRQDLPPESPNSIERIESTGWGTDPEPIQSPDPNADSYAPDSSTESPNWSERIEPTGWGADPDQDPSPSSPKVRMSWADMAQEEDELAEEEEKARERVENDGVKEGEKKKVELSREQREWIRFNNVGRKKDFICLERVKGKIVNILEGLELHTGVFSAVEQKRIVEFVYELQEKGRKSELGERTYSEPQKWMRGKGRVTIQYGCCYNYAMDKDGNPPGILHNVSADPIPSLFKVIIRRLIRWHVLPTSCVPNSCIVNIYEPGDCIPPHIDNHDFVRPFSTVSFLSECNILFGANLKIEGPGEFSGSTAIPLPVGSVLVLNGNGADVAKHCVPAVPAKRISITFRKMDPSKHPIGFIPEPDLENIQPLPTESGTTTSRQRSNSSSSDRQVGSGSGTESRSFRKGRKYRGRSTGPQHLHYDSETTPNVRPREVMDVRSATSSNSSFNRDRSSAERPSDPRPRQYLQDFRDEPVFSRRPLQNEGSGYSEDGSESSRRRVQVDQKRMIISRNMREDDESGSARHLHGPMNNGRRRVRVVISDDQ